MYMYLICFSHISYCWGTGTLCKDHSEKAYSFSLSTCSVTVAVFWKTEAKVVGTSLFLIKCNIRFLKLITMKHLWLFLCLTCRVYTQKKPKKWKILIYWFSREKKIQISTGHVQLKLQKYTVTCNRDLYTSPHEPYVAFGYLWWVSKHLKLFVLVL